MSQIAKLWKVIVNLKWFKNHWLEVLRSILIAMGLLWLPIEAYEGLSNSEATLPFSWFVFISIIAGICFYFYDGHMLTGYLKSNVNIVNQGVDSNITIKTGDLFCETGWKAIAVNDFFDSIVDDVLISSNSLHGYVIQTYWPDDRQSWQKQVNSTLQKYDFQKVSRGAGNERRYPVGTTGYAAKGTDKFLFVALSQTDSSNNVTVANAEDLICATRGLLRRARELCSDEPLFIPLMGSGLARIGIKHSVLVDLMLTAIIEESKIAKVTSDITIVIPLDKSEQINLQNYVRNWN